MTTSIDPIGAFEIDHLGDALGIGLDLTDMFDGPFCALWLGDDIGTVLDFVVLTDERGRDVDRLVLYAAVGASVDPCITRAVLWHTVDDITDVPDLAAQFFSRRDRLELSWVDLVDEIAVADEELRSLAVTTLSDEAGWDDVTHLLDVADGA